MNLNDEQRAAVQSEADNTLVVASAGSGKTAVLAARIAWRIYQGVKPSDIVAITYTRSAAAELQERITLLLRGDPEVGVAHLRPDDEPFALDYIGTIHGYALRVLSRCGMAVGLPDKVGVMDEAQAEELLQELADSLHYKGTRRDLDAAVAQRLAGVKTGALSPADLVAFEFVNRMLTDGALSFDAVIAFATQTFPFDQFAGRELFVDEMQDASDLTFRFVTEHPGRKFFVSDPDQSIFAFNGGNVRNVLGLLSKALCCDSDWVTFTLSTNYRSTVSICDVANRLIGHNKARAPKLTIPADLNNRGTAVRFLQFPNAHAELSAIHADILTETSLASSAPLPSVAVLCRTNALREAATAFFEGAGLAVRRRATRVLPASWDVVRAFVATVSAPDNDTLAHWWLKTTVGPALADSHRAAAAKAATSIQRLLEMPPVKDIRQIMAILAGGKGGLRWGVTPEALGLLAETIDSLPPGAGFPELSVAIARAGEDVVQDGDGVTVSTIHGFKGCEAEMVFLCGFDDEIIPGNATGAALEELRRLAFVGVTRARNRLTVTTAKERKAGPWMHRPEPATPSRFIAEMGGKL